MKDTQSMTPDAKAKAFIKILFFFFDIKIRIVPNMVESPAKVVKKKPKEILFIGSP